MRYNMIGNREKHEKCPAVSRHKATQSTNNKDKMAHFRNLHKENSSKIPSQWIYWSINAVLNLFLTHHIPLNQCKNFQLELF